MLGNILSTEIKERAIILTVKTVGFLARMDNKKYFSIAALTIVAGSYFLQMI